MSISIRLGLEAGERTLDLATELGITGVPISAQALALDGVETTLMPLRARGLCACQIGAFGYNPLSANTEGQERQERLLRQAIPLAAETGCPYVVIGPGNYHPSGFGAHDPRNDLPEALDRMAEALHPMLLHAKRHGARLTVEPYLKAVVNSAERFMALWNRLQTDSLCCNVDPTSLYGYHDLLDPEAKLRETCLGLVGHYGLVHLKEVALQEGFHLHAGLAPIGAGNTDWAQLLELAAPYVPGDGWAIIEHVQTPEEGRASATLLRAAAEHAGVELT